MIGAAQPCRVCLAEGTWNIFGSNVINDEMCTVASINHIRDKLLYVTQLQMNADDGLPFLICELCIVQLNLAYRFKQLATDSDSTLRELKNTSRTPTPNIENALVYANEPVVQDVPEEALAVTKHEQEEESSSVLCIQPAREITISPMVVNESSIDTCTPTVEASVSHATPDPVVAAPAMVCLQKDIINPAEDEAFIKDIIKKEVISMPWPLITECTTTDTEENGSSSPPQSKTPTPKQLAAQQKSRKSPSKRSRSVSEQEQRTSGSENSLKKKPKVAKMKAKRATVVPVTRAAKPNQSPSTSNSDAAANQSSKPTKAKLQTKRLQKELENLRIDMVNQRNEWLEQATAQNTIPGLVIVPMKRRNSICVSSLRSFL